MNLLKQNRKIQLFGMAMMMALLVAISTGCEKEGKIAGDGVIDGHTYMDLGLPSGTLWAACNVGAKLPEEYGKYFSWGEIKAKENYNWQSYVFADGAYNKLNKYCNKAFYGADGFTDSLEVLLQDDDVASVQWSKKWKMPTREQWDELMTLADYKMTERNGVKGYLFTHGNSSVFLPAAGVYHDSTLVDASSNGIYWSGSLDTDYPNRAWYFCFYVGHCGVGYRDRNFGLTVRPVSNISELNE